MRSTPRHIALVRIGTKRCRCGHCLPSVERLQWGGSSSWQDGEAAVRRLPTLERQVTGTLLPDCAIKPPAAEADLPSLPALEPVTRPQLPIKTENVLPRLLVAAPDQPVELAEPAIP